MQPSLAAAKANQMAADIMVVSQPGLTHTLENAYEPASCLRSGGKELPGSETMVRILLVGSFGLVRLQFEQDDTGQRRLSLHAINPQSLMS